MPCETIAAGGTCDTALHAKRSTCGLCTRGDMGGDPRVVLLQSSSLECSAFSLGRLAWRNETRSMGNNWLEECIATTSVCVSDGVFAIISSSLGTVSVTCVRLGTVSY